MPPASNTTGQSQPYQPRNGATDGQTDGAGDAWEAVLVQRDGQGHDSELGRVQIDHLIRDQVEEMGRRMEGGGLMVPLDERTSYQKSKKRKAAVAELSRRTALGNVAGLSSAHPDPTQPSHSQHSNQLDGLDDSDSDTKEGIDLGGGAGIKDDPDAPDEDAINSELDDSDDNLGQEEDDDAAMTQVMLCMYDKVQRVKNKWKCTLKDGVLTVNGKEYVSSSLPTPPTDLKEIYCAAGQWLTPDVGMSFTRRRGNLSGNPQTRDGYAVATASN